MPAIPEENVINSAFAMFKEGYEFIQKRAILHDSDIFKISLPGKSVICLTGAEAAQIFYDPDKFVRKGAIPNKIQKTLLGKRTVHTLDDEVHKSRKSMFMSVMTEESIKRLTTKVEENWRNYVLKWIHQDQIVLFTQSQQLLCKSVCSWAGVPLGDSEVEVRANDFAAMVDGFGGFGLRHWRGKQARKRTEKWIIALIQNVRNGEFTAVEGTPLHLVSHYKDQDGNALEDKVAAVELINLLRPTVAISYYITFAALALFENPGYCNKIRNKDEGFTEKFINEVRRYFPFAPFIGAQVKETFQWKGYTLPKGTLVLLDIYGTNHDIRYWESPDTFWPYNFNSWSKSPFDFIPQGGGEYFNGHRCPGEWITIEIMKVSLKFLTSCIQYDVPDQDMDYSLKRMPTFPKSGFIIEKVRLSKELIFRDSVLLAVNS